MPFFLTDATLFALGEFSRTNTLLPTQGDWANTSDGFLHLIGYFLYAYTKEGHYILERKEVLETIEKNYILLTPTCVCLFHIRFYLR